MERKQLTDEDYKKIENLFISIDGLSLSSESLSEKNDICSDFEKCSLSKTNNLGSTQKVESWEGFLLGVKIVVRPNNLIMIFAISKTSFWKITQDLENIIPKYTSVIKEGCYMWVKNEVDSYILFKKLKEIDGTLMKI